MKVFETLTLRGVRNDHRMLRSKFFVVWKCPGGGTLLNTKCPAPRSHLASDARICPGMMLEEEIDSHIMGISILNFESLTSLLFRNWYSKVSVWSIFPIRTSLSVYKYVSSIYIVLYQVNLVTNPVRGWFWWPDSRSVLTKKHICLYCPKYLTCFTLSTRQDKNKKSVLNTSLTLIYDLCVTWSARGKNLETIVCALGSTSWAASRNSASRSCNDDD